MAKTLEASDSEEVVHLKDPELSAFLAWLIPGLGHLYQGRIAKGVLFLVCIMGTFAYGLYLGGSAELGWGRTVYFSWGEGRKRLPYLCQIGVGLPALPALIQAYRAEHDKRVWWGGFMAPPRLPGGLELDPNADQPDEHRLRLELYRFFELGELYTMLAGLLNVLAIYDAWAGPVVTEGTRKKEPDEEGPDDAQAPSPASS